MTKTIRDRIVEVIWSGWEPFSEQTDRPVDLQGWNSDHLFLREAIDALPGIGLPSVVVEVGVWKGASTINMARRMREIGRNGVVIAVDTWLGSEENWPPVEGLYQQFLANVVADPGLSEYIVPLPLDSGSACNLLMKHGITARALHIDASHDYLSARVDLERWWQVLEPGGVLIADDYPQWRGVKQAVDEFRATRAHTEFEFDSDKARMWKP